MSTRRSMARMERLSKYSRDMTPVGPAGDRVSVEELQRQFEDMVAESRERRRREYLADCPDDPEFRGLDEWLIRRNAEREIGPEPPGPEPGDPERDRIRAEFHRMLWRRRRAAREQWREAN